MKSRFDNPRPICERAKAKLFEFRLEVSSLT
jgi:hypothetical protein